MTCPYAHGGGKKTRKNRKTKKLINTRNKSCKLKKCTTCCPNMKPINNKYLATNEKSVLHYNNKKYKLHTCCLHCSKEMNLLAKMNPNKFKKMYISKEKDCCLELKNKYTGKMVQKAKLIKN